MDKQLAERIGRDVKNILEAIADKYGMTVEYRGGVYDSFAGTYKPKIEFKSADTGRKEFDRWAPLYGLKPESFGAEFVAGGRKFAIVGVAPKSTRRPILAKGEDGRIYKFEASYVAAMLPKGEAK